MYNTCKMPRSVACTGDGHFIVGSFNNSIHKYNKHGQKIMEEEAIILSRLHQHRSQEQDSGL